MLSLCRQTDGQTDRQMDNGITNCPRIERCIKIFLGLNRLYFQPSRLVGFMDLVLKELKDLVLKESKVKYLTIRPKCLGLNLVLKELKVKYLTIRPKCLGLNPLKNMISLHSRGLVKVCRNESIIEVGIENVIE